MAGKVAALRRSRIQQKEEGKRRDAQADRSKESGRIIAPEIYEPIRRESMIRHSNSQSRRNLGRAAIIVCVTLMGAADVAVTQTNGPGNQGPELSQSWIGGYW